MKTKHITRIYPLLCLFLLETVTAQETAFDKASHSIGFIAGTTFGAGITYRSYAGPSYLQYSFFARTGSQESASRYMLGLSYGRVLSEIKIVKALPPTALVFVTGLDGLYNKEQSFDSNQKETFRTNKSAHAGVGIALEIGNNFTPGLLFSLATTYVLSLERIDGVSEWNLGPQIYFGLLYNW